MITNGDLAVIPGDTARTALGAARAAVSERVALQLTTRCLDRVQRVLLRLLARAGLADPETRAALRREADELAAAVRAAREVLYPQQAGAGPAGDDPGATDRTVETALLDTAGTIVWVDAAWQDFCRANGGDPGRAGVGRSFLAICDAASDPDSATVAAAIREALRGDLPAPARIEVRCDAPTHPRLFDVLVSSRLDDEGAVLGATVTLSEVVPATRTRSSSP